MELYEKSQNLLELPAVLELLAAEAVSEGAKERARALTPTTDKNEAYRRLRETTAAKTMMAVKGSPSFSGVTDVRSPLARADIGGMLNTRELLRIAEVLRTARVVAAYATSEQGERTEIDYLFSSLHGNRFLEEKITNSIVGEDEIADAASAELASIRRLIRANSAKVRDILQKIISSPSYSKILQEPIITTRSERFVVPVKAEHKNSVPGLVHDISASGATLFIEPMGVVKVNNELRELAAKERNEIDRILMELSADAASFRDDINTDYEVLTTLDMIFARARLSYQLDCGEPILTDDRVELRKARHPLLPKGKAVPIDVSVGGSFDTLMITGPNTGGKTVTLKTIGLLCLMAACGLHIPAGDGSSVKIFTRLLADIGDEQSIEQSLSTFSSHMKNIVSILEVADGETLLLFDELGAGTDPVEGAALAIAIIERCRHLGALVAATTHYAELKVYATNEPGVMNASCEFDVETLRPTYRLLIGIPGKSNAFAISERLGLPAAVIEDAKKRITAENATLEDTISKLEQQRFLMEKDRVKAQQELREAEETLKKNERLRRELEVRLEKADEKAKREAQRILSDARAEAERVFAELDRMRSETKKAQDADHVRINEERSTLRRELNEAEEQLHIEQPEPEPTKKSARPIQAGDTVQILSLGVKAEVVSVSPERILSLQAGIMRVNAREDEVLLLEGEKRPDIRRHIEKSEAKLREAVSPELDLRGMMTDEAIPVLERFIDSACLSRLTTVTIIHGKGTGALRAAVQQSLRRNKQVKSYRLGRYGEGETGVTIVELK